MRILNFRAGFATNSSSSHSVILLSPDMIGQVSGIGSQGTNDHFGWDYFRLVTEEDKLRYLAAQFFSNYSSDSAAVRDIVARIDAAVTGFADEHAEALDKLDTEEGLGWGELPTVDHQSVLGLPTYDGEMLDSMIAFFRSPRVVVLGGNDNSDGNNSVEGSAPVGFLDRLRDRRSDTGYVSRREGDIWTIFNRDDGNKVRFSFQENDLDATAYTKSVLPELIDVKITNWCDGGCKFCVDGDTLISTPTGVAPIKDLSEGDSVLVWSFDDKCVETAPIIETYRRDYTGDILDIEMEDGSVLTITPEHEVYVPARGWILAAAMNEGDDVVDIREVR